MMELMDSWEILEKIKANPVIRNIPVLMIPQRRSLPRKQRSTARVPRILSQSPSTPQLPDAINRIIERRKIARTEAIHAKDKDVNPGRIEEYSALRKCIEADKNLLVILKKSGRTLLSERVVLTDEIAAVSRPGTKTFADEQRLDEINGKLPQGLELRFHFRGWIGENL
jgi:CheY-like chemotaxis protein